MASAPRLVVIGSANMDLIVRAAHIPAPGETILGGEFSTVSGGKGANQAVAAARLGATVRFVGRVGKDSFGEALIAEMTRSGVLPDYIRRDPVLPTGVALIGVDAKGQNAILVAPGANGNTGIEDVEAARASIENADAMVVQLEIPAETVAYEIALAHRAGTRVLFNPAPVGGAASLGAEVFSQTDILIPNEHEVAGLLGYAGPEGMDFGQAAQELRCRGVGTVVVTLGAEGCLVATESGTQHLPALQVNAVDTTAAGDCFTGALAVALGEGRDITQAAQFALRAAAFSVTRRGAQTSLPWRAEVESDLPETSR